MKKEIKESRQENSNYLNGITRAVAHLIVIPCILCIATYLMNVEHVGYVALGYLFIITVLETIRLKTSDSENQIIYSYAFFDVLEIFGIALFLGVISYVVVVII